MAQILNWIGHRQWIAFFLLAVLFHLLIFLIRFEWATPPLPPRVELQQYNSKQLEALRNQWKERKLLLNRDPNRPREKEAPENARYDSDRNTRVEKEQRARVSDVIPKPGTQVPQPQIDASTLTPRTPTKPQTQARDLPKLGNLGVPFRLNEKSSPEAEAERANEIRQRQIMRTQSADQTVLEDLPEGGENMLNTQESIYYSFYARITEAVGPIWQSKLREEVHRNLNPGDYVSVIEVVLDESGHLLQTRKIQSSGILELDRAAEKCWWRIKSFPNPPKGLLKGERQVRFAFSFTLRVGNAPAFQFLQPERIY